MNPSRFPAAGLYEDTKGKRFRVLGPVFDFYNSPMNHGDILMHPDGKPHVFWRMSLEQWTRPVTVANGQAPRFSKVGP